MTALICGSVAYDNIMVFEDSFKNHILPDKIHMLNVAFLVPKLRRKSIAQEVISLLEAHVSTPRELERRRELFQRALRMSARRAPGSGPFPSAEEMLREDRAR